MVNRYLCLNGLGNKKLINQYVSVLFGVFFSASHVYAVSFEINENWKLSTNTNLSLGASWSTQSASTSLLY